MGKTKKVAGGDEPIVGVEVVLKPVIVQIPLITVPVEIPHAAVTVRALPDKNMQNIIRATAH